MKNQDKPQFQPVKDLISFFGTQEKLAEALGVEQGTVTGWLNFRHGVSERNALKAERITNGQVKAVDLCPVLAEVM